MAGGARRGDGDITASSTEMVQWRVWWWCYSYSSPYYYLLALPLLSKMGRRGRPGTIYCRTTTRDKLNTNVLQQTT